LKTTASEVALLLLGRGAKRQTRGKTWTVTLRGKEKRYARIGEKELVNLDRKKKGAQEKGRRKLSLLATEKEKRGHNGESFRVGGKDRGKALTFIS